MEAITPSASRAVGPASPLDLSSPRWSVTSCRHRVSPLPCAHRSRHRVGYHADGCARAGNAWATLFPTALPCLRGRPERVELRCSTSFFLALSRMCPMVVKPSARRYRPVRSHWDVCPFMRTPRRLNGLGLTTFLFGQRGLGPGGGGQTLIFRETKAFFHSRPNVGIDPQKGDFQIGLRRGERPEQTVFGAFQLVFCGWGGFGRLRRRR